ncbi:spondin-1-like [Oratosquilla oratoria]|uniref:spondin-1-like n=1 Tax=Oratosquilla oratoria TaxID=337810 RepID=UPI003F765D4D
MMEQASRPWVVLTTFTVCLGWIVMGVDATLCDRSPASLETPKTIGDNGFMVKVSGHSNTYIPGDVHTVTLRSYNSHGAKKKFTKFLLVVEPANRQRNNYGVTNVGTFQLQTDSLSMYSEDCPNAVTQTSPIPKKDIQVLWRAPPSGSGCVIFKVTLVGQNDQWYMDEGRLSKLMCEDAPHPKPRENVKECCACNEAKYEVTFECLWSRQTHPKDFPTNKWLTYFSDIIGASHSPVYKLWEYGGCASDGLKQLAEDGFTQALEREMKWNNKRIRTIIKARGTQYQDFSRKSFAIFRVDKKNHLMSLVSKFAPSPDWFVGVSSLDLCQANCTWLENKTINLYPVDGGTNSGLTYSAKSESTTPQQKIYRITNSYPNSLMSPFFDPSGEPMKPIARVVIQRQRLYHRDCPGHPQNPIMEVVDIDAHKPECEVSRWSVSSVCSVTCGTGTRESSRYYSYPKNAKLVACRRKLKKIEKCYPGVSCFATDNEIIPPHCSVTQWSQWSQCSAKCGRGNSVRKRQFVVPALRENCNVSTMATRVCYGDEKDCIVKYDEAEATEVCQLPLEVGTCLQYHQRWFFNISEAKCVVFSYSGCDGNRNNFVGPEDCMKTCRHLMPGYTSPLKEQAVASLVKRVNCVVTQWAEWSNCSTTCGKGKRIRTRKIMVYPQNGGKKCPCKLKRSKKCKNPRCRQKKANHCI